MALSCLEEKGAPADEGVNDLVLAVEHQVGEWLEEDVVFAAFLAELQEGVKAAVVEHFEVVMRVMIRNVMIDQIRGEKTTTFVFSIADDVG